MSTAEWSTRSWPENSGQASDCQGRLGACRKAACHHISRNSRPKPIVQHPGPRESDLNVATALEARYDLFNQADRETARCV